MGCAAKIVMIARTPAGKSSFAITASFVPTKMIAGFCVDTTRTRDERRGYELSSANSDAAAEEREGICECIRTISSPTKTALINMITLI